MLSPPIDPEQSTRILRLMAMLGAAFISGQKLANAVYPSSSFTTDAKEVLFTPSMVSTKSRSRYPLRASVATKPLSVTATVIA